MDGLWDAVTGQEMACLKGHASPLSCASFSPDGGRVVTASGNVGSGALSLRPLGVAWPVRADASPSDNTARIWELETGREVGVISGHRKKVNAAAFSSDGARVATEDGTARVWDAVSGHEIACMAGHRFWVKSVAFSPDGERIATGSWGQYGAGLGCWDGQGNRCPGGTWQSGELGLVQPMRQEGRNGLRRQDGKSMGS